MNRLSYRHQRTLARPAEVGGIGFLTGADARLRFLPAAPDAGIVFLRTDLVPKARVPATACRVTGTARRTTLGHAPAQVTLVEHVLAALAGLRIDNCTVELNAIEPPGLDGSAGEFVEALLAAGAVVQPARVPTYAPSAPVTVAASGATLTLYPPNSPDDDFRVTYTLNYGHGSPIDRQSHTLTATPERFAAEVAHCRTFLLESEADRLRQQGFGERLSPKDLLVFGSCGPISNTLRFANEPARHKCLDCIGDLALCGFDLCGHLVAYRSGHPLNVELARTLVARIATRLAA